MQSLPKLPPNIFTKFSQDTDYIRDTRVCKDQKWVTPTPYGDLDITINLSKPEKGSQGDCGRQERQTERLSQMPAVYGKRLCRT